VSILVVDEGVFEVLSTAGATHLGGEDFDQRIVNHLASKFRSKTKVDITRDGEAMSKLKKAAEEAKITLTTQQVYVGQESFGRTPLTMQCPHRL